MIGNGMTSGGKHSVIGSRRCRETKRIDEWSGYPKGWKRVE